MQIVAIVVSLALTVVAMALLVPAIREMVSVVRSGQPAPGRAENPAGRMITMLKETVLHTRMLQWTVVGVMHWFVFAAFIFLSTAVLGAYFQLFQPDWVWPIFGHWYPFEWFSELIGLLSTIGIIYLIVYRQMNNPKRTGRSSRFYGSNMGRAYFVEYLALLEGGAILFIRGAEYNLGVAEGHDTATRAHFPIASFVGDVLFPSGADSVHALENIIVFIAMFKIALAMVWLMVIARNLTMGIAWHRFTAWFNIFFKRESDGSTALGAMKPLTSGGKPVTLDDIEDMDEDTRLGVGAVEDYSWKGLLDFTTCTECGRCQSQCPAWNTEKPLSPKLFITAMRDATYAKAPYLRAGGEGSESATALLEGDEALAREVERPLVGDTGDGWFYMPEDGSGVIDPDVLWSCTSCGACVQQCPVDIEHVDHIMDMRRYQVLVEANFPAELNQLFKGLENKGNPWNMSSSARLEWAKGMDPQPKVVGEDIESLDEVEWLFWVGCAGAYEDRAKKTTRAVAELLELAGVTYGVLGNGETCTGDPARRAGNEFVFQGLAQQNAEVLTEAKAKKVVSTCAHCFNTLKNEYAAFGVELEVVHHTQLLNRLVREGKLTPVAEGAGAAKRSITYHDPCYLGRHNQVYSPPRELLQVLPGAEVVEMERNSERSFCCGAGGARMWMEEKLGERINVNRTKEAVGTGADQIAVGCPFCRVMLSDGLTAEQASGNAREEVEVLDVAQMLLASVKGEVATRTKKEEPAAKKSAAPPGPTAKQSTPAAAAAPAAEPEAAPAGLSLFDTPEETAATTAPAAAGGSLFDVGGDTESGTPEPAPEAKTGPEAGQENAQDTGRAEPNQPTEPASGGSLFDIGGDKSTAPTASSTAVTQPESIDTKPAPIAAEGPSAFGGSLFDIPGEEPASAPADDAPEPAVSTGTQPSNSANSDAAAPAEPAAPASQPAATKIPEGGSLFDITAPEPSTESTAPASAPTSAGAAPAAATPEATVAKEPAPAAVTEIPEGGSLFDITAPEPDPSTESPQAPAADASVPDASAAEGSAPEDDSPASDVDASAPSAPAAPQVAPDVMEIPEGVSLFEVGSSAAETEVSEESTDPPEPSGSTDAPEAEQTVSEESQPSAPSAPAASQPRTDVDINSSGSLFDL